MLSEGGMQITDFGLHKVFTSSLLKYCDQLQGLLLTNNEGLAQSIQGKVANMKISM